MARQKPTGKELIKQTRFHLILGTLAVVAEIISLLFMTWIKAVSYIDYILLFVVVLIWLWLFSRHIRAKNGSLKQGL